MRICLGSYRGFLDGLSSGSVRHSRSQRFFSTTLKRFYMYECGEFVECAESYRPGGNHPVQIGDTFDEGRYSIVNKLGYGWWSTIWLAKDQQGSAQDYVAIKILRAELTGKSREVKVTQMLAAAAATTDHPGSKHVATTTAHFQLEGPNGVHDCLVYRVMGPQVTAVTGWYFEEGYRLPGRLAKRFAKQALLGLDFLHQHGVGHGDLHPGNLVLQGPSVENLQEHSCLQGPMDGYVVPVRRTDGKPLDKHVPPYLVDSMWCPTDLTSPSIRIIDFGEAFFANSPPSKLCTTEAVQAPEVLYGYELDIRADLWSMGCLLCELVIGVSPFSTLSSSGRGEVGQGFIIEQWTDALGEVPERSKKAQEAIDRSRKAAEAKGQGLDRTSPRLQEMLEEIYYFENLEPEDAECVKPLETDLTREDLRQWGDIVKRMLRYDPAERASAKEILQDPWFDDVD